LKGYLGFGALGEAQWPSWRVMIQYVPILVKDYKLNAILSTPSTVTYYIYAFGRFCICIIFKATYN